LRNPADSLITDLHVHEGFGLLYSLYMTILAHVD